MKILFVVPQIPFPIDTGAKIRTYNHIKNLSALHSVSVIGFAGHRATLEGFEKLLGKVKIIGVKRKNSWMDRLESLIMSFFSKKPYVVLKYDCAKMREVLKSKVRDGEYDIVHFDHIHMAQYVDLVPDIPACLDEHNVEYIIAERLCEKLPFGLKKFFVKWQASKMKAYEKERIDKFRAVFTVSLTDANLLEKLSHKGAVHVASNGVNCRDFAYQMNTRKPQQLVFIGSLDWWPNIDAMKWFFTDIWGSLSQALPRLTCSIVGRKIHSSLKTYFADEKISVYQNVEDIRPYFLDADILIVPIRIGGGTRIKILESMALGRPVVSTTIGAEGIEAEDKKEIMLADTPKAFIEKISLLTQSKDDYLRIAESARKLVEEKYDWAQIAREMARVYQEAAG
ncbi:glycosyltransferase [PVC group bacterium]|nr:glycosyltransferase [PVC group bacterium]